MSRDWTPEELQTVSRFMKLAGHMSYEEFCTELERKMTIPGDEGQQKAPSASSVGPQQAEGQRDR